MKCGLKTPTKLSPSKSKHGSSPSKHDSSPSKHEQPPCKEYGSPQKLDCLETNIDQLSPTKVDSFKQGRPVNNKENLLRRLEAAEVNNIDCSPLQDSGYASILHNDSQSQDEEDEFSTSCLPTFETPKQLGSQSEKPTSVCLKSMLPALRFEEAICSTLKKSSKGSPRFDWDAIEEVASREAYGLDKLIGRKMGLERMDILGELFKKDFKHLLCNILRHLSAMDLINVISVSSTWRKIVQMDSWAYSVYQKCSKEICEKEARHAEHAATRDSSLFRLPLASVQKIASAACCVSKKKCNKKKPSTPHSRLIEFNEVGKTLNNDKSLKACRDCGSPAKLDTYLHRAICTRESCQLDFCTLCNCEYHFSKDCMSSVKHNHKYLSQPLPGSKKSKQNLRRL